MRMTSEEILPAIRQGGCRKICFPGFENASYFADQNGNIYSLNNPEEPRYVEPKLGKGLLWVALYERDACIRKLMVGDLIAHTFLEAPANGEQAVTYRDGDPSNNTVGNLSWGTKQEQQDQLRMKQMARVEAPETPTERKEPDSGSNKPSLLEGLAGTHPDATPVAVKRTEDPLLDQLRMLQARIKQHEKRVSMLTQALQPFACFELSPAHAADFGNAVVLSANEGRNRQSTLTVHDFRFAHNVFNSEQSETKE